MSGFAAATAVTPSGDGMWEAAIAPGWDIAGNANGGYLMAMTARAATLAADRSDPVAVTAHFVAPGTPGPVTVQTQVLKQGRRFSTVEATLAAERPLARLLGTFGDLGDGAGHLERLGSEPPSLPPPDDCLRVEPTDTFPPPFVGRVDLRLHPDTGAFGVPGSAHVSGWLRLRDGEPVDTLSLLLAADALPPAVFFTDFPISWVPTVELTVHVRHRPRPGWLRCAFTTRFVTGGFLEEDGEIWDESGRLVAQSRQLALVPRG